MGEFSINVNDCYVSRYEVLKGYK